MGSPPVGAEQAAAAQGFAALTSIQAGMFDKWLPALRIAIRMREEARKRDCADQVQESVRQAAD